MSKAHSLPPSALPLRAMSVLVRDVGHGRDALFCMYRVVHMRRCRSLVGCAVFCISFVADCVRVSLCATQDWGGVCRDYHLHAAGFSDPFRQVKADENSKALAHLPTVLR
jgi:hypothetical protein